MRVKFVKSINLHGRGKDINLKFEYASDLELPLVRRGTASEKADLCACVLAVNLCPTNGLVVSEQRWRLAGRQCISSKSTQLRFSVNVAPHAIF